MRFMGWLSPMTSGLHSMTSKSSSVMVVTMWDHVPTLDDHNCQERSGQDWSTHCCGTKCASGAALCHCCKGGSCGGSQPQDLSFCALLKSHVIVIVDRFDLLARVADIQNELSMRIVLDQLRQQRHLWSRTGGGGKWNGAGRSRPLST